MKYLDYLRNLSKTKKVVGYFDTYFPQEFLIALDMHPVRLMSDDMEPVLSNAYIQGFCCPYAKNLLEQAFKGRFEFLAGVVFTRYCDSLRGVFEVWKSEKLSPFVEYIRYAQVTRESSATYLAKEFLRVFNNIAAFSGKKLVTEKLKEAVKNVNDIRKALLYLYELRKKGNITATAEEFYNLVFSSTYLEYQEFINNCKSFEINHFGNLKSDKPKVIISAAEIDSPKFFHLLDETGFRVVSDDISSGTRFYKDLVSERGEDIDEIAVNIAIRYITKPPCSLRQMV